MKKKYTFLIPIIIFLFLFSCQTEETDNQFIVPTNLTVSYNIGDDDSGNISLEAQAKNAFTYTFSPDTNKNYFERNTTGVFKHQYTTSGKYTIEVRAYANSNEYDSWSKEIDVSIAGFDEGYDSDGTYEGMQLVWEDNFDGNTLNEEFWNYEIGTGEGGWGNQEKQYYRKENTTVSDGYLTITAKKESYEGSSYTSSRLTTQNKQSFKYGRIDIRAKLPTGKGMWPALWMLGDNFSQVGWPKCGEIDIMELRGDQPNKVVGTLHWDENDQRVCTCDQNKGITLTNKTFNDEFHVFSIIWDEYKIDWLVNNEKFHTIDITPAGLDEFRNSFFLIFNVAVGGTFIDNQLPDDTNLPQRMIVDYVKVYQKN